MLRYTYVFFVNYVEAFHNMRRNKMWNIMDRRDILEQSFGVLRNMYKDTEIIVNAESGDVLNYVINW